MLMDTPRPNVKGPGSNIFWLVQRGLGVDTSTDTVTENNGENISLDINGDIFFGKLTQNGKVKADT